ncbi:MAG TPA: PDZ domain-containing protein [Acidimicrobiales bacterium]|nr:PDZ domain-containing protein [Acidimicrobiales bacterium]
MQERIREDGFEATFVVATPRKEAWDRLVEARPASDKIPQPRAGQWWVPGIEAPADELEVAPPSFLRVRKAVEPCKGTEIVLTLEDEGSGSRITIVQTGFGPGFSDHRPWLSTGWYSILADLVVFFERGVSLGRHLTWWADIGCGVAETDEGLVVGAVAADAFAARAGLQPGDLIVLVDGTPVLDVRDLSVLTRGPLLGGGEATVRYLRGNEVLTGVATV